MKNCENCGGEGLIHQGESIKFTCSQCGGTGKSGEVVMASEETVISSEPVIEEVDESFLDAASEGLEVPSPEAEEVL